MKTLRRIDVVNFLPRAILTSIFVSLFLLIAPMTSAQTFDEIRSAAQQGDMKAQFNLGLMYATGEGVPENFVKAYSWVSIARAQGLTRADATKSYLREAMSPEQMAEAQSLSSRCFASDYKLCD